MIHRTKRLLASPSTYPLGTFWMVATIVLPMAVSGFVNLNVGVGILTAAATTLVFVAFKRDLDLVQAEHVELVARVQQLIDALHRECIPIPPARAVGTHRKAM